MQLYALMSAFVGTTVVHMYVFYMQTTSGDCAFDKGGSACPCKGRLLCTSILRSRSTYEQQLSPEEDQSILVDFYAFTDTYLTHCGVTPDYLWWG